jgi:hypothetical protein
MRTMPTAARRQFVDVVTFSHTVGVGGKSARGLDDMRDG